MNTRIKALRKRLDKTQAAFGENIRISGPAVAKLESGINSPSDQTIELICSVYNVNSRWLKDGITKVPGKVTDEDMFLDLVSDDDLINKVMFGENEFAKSVMREFAKLGDSEWRLLEKLVKNIVSGLPKEEEKKKEEKEKSDP